LTFELLSRWQMALIAIFFTKLVGEWHVACVP
jgi:hypothetical protein